jgi:hypothetical protein
MSWEIEGEDDVGETRAILKFNLTLFVIFWDEYKHKNPSL